MNFKIFVFPIFKAIYKFLGSAVPKNNKRIGFVSYPDASDNSWHLYNYMQKNLKGHEFVWFCKEPETIKHKIQYTENNKTNLVKKNTIKGLLKFMTCSSIFFTHGTYFFATKSKGPTLVNLWHGMPIKVISYLDGKSELEVEYCDYSISTSEFYTQTIAQAFNIEDHRVINSGLPRNDALINSSLHRNEILRRLGIELESNFILWLPTYRKSIVGDIRTDAVSENFLTEISDIGLSKINAAAKSKNTHIIIKIHPMDILNKGALPKFENIHIFSQKDWDNLNLDLYESLAHSSAIITDLSSVIIDYITTEKPIGIFAQAKNYSRKIIPGLRIEDLQDACFSLNNENDIVDFITNPPKKNKNQNALTKYNSNTANNYKSACQHITQILIIKNKLP